MSLNTADTELVNSNEPKLASLQTHTRQRTCLWTVSTSHLCHRPGSSPARACTIPPHVVLGASEIPRIQDITDSNLGSEAGSQQTYWTRDLPECLGVSKPPPTHRNTHEVLHLLKLDKGGFVSTPRKEPGKCLGAFWHPGRLRGPDFEFHRPKTKGRFSWGFGMM